MLKHASSILKNAPLLILQILVFSKPNLIANFSHAIVTLSMILISLSSLNFRISRSCSFGLSPIGERVRGGREGKREGGPRGRERRN